MSQVKEDSPISSGLKLRLRDIFSPKPRVTPSHFSTSHPPSGSTSSTPLPSRIPIRKKRSFRDVAEDESDKSSIYRARIRQRVDSTSSIVTVRGEKVISKKSSSDSVKTICERKEKLHRTPSSLSISLNPGQATPARAVLTRTTSHNQVEAPSSPIQEKRSVLPFPTKRLASLNAPARTGTSRHTAGRASIDVSSTTISARESHALKRARSSRSLSASFVKDAVAATQTARPSASASPPALSLPEALQSPLSPQDDMLRQVLEYVVNESEDDDADALEYTLRRSPTIADFTSPTCSSTFSVPDSSLPEIPDDEDEEEISVPRRDPPQFGERVFYPPKRPSRSHLDRFDIKVQPFSKHVALWDLKAGDVYAWPALLCITDNHLDYTDIEGPPVKYVELNFSNIDDTSVQASSSPSSSATHDYHVTYDGLHVETDVPHKLLCLDPEGGIGVEGRWVRGPFTDESHISSARLELPPSFTCTASWATRIFVPIPASLFKGRECRYFKLKAKVGFEGWDGRTTVAHSGTVKVSIEHLKKEVHMDGRRASLDQ